MQKPLPEAAQEAGCKLEAGWGGWGGVPAAHCLNKVIKLLNATRERGKMKTRIVQWQRSV